MPGSEGAVPEQQAGQLISSLSEVMAMARRAERSRGARDTGIGSRVRDPMYDPIEDRQHVGSGGHWMEREREPVGVIDGSSVPLVEPGAHELVRAERDAVVAVLGTPSHPSTA